MFLCLIPIKAATHVNPQTLLNFIYKIAAFTLPKKKLQ